jgi:hypothetical protein
MKTLKEKGKATGKKVQKLTPRKIAKNPYLPFAVLKEERPWMNRILDSFQQVARETWIPAQYQHLLKPHGKIKSALH